MHRIMFLVPVLGGGGAEMHVARLANHLDRARFAPSVAAVWPGGDYESRLAPDVPLYRVSGMGPSRTLWWLRAVAPLRALFAEHRPHLVFSVLTHTNAAAVIAAVGIAKGPAVVVGEQVPPGASLRGIGRRPFLARLLKRWYYPRARAVVALSRGTAAELTAMVPRLNGRVHVIPNAGFDAQVLAQAAEPLPPELPRPAEPLIVACGRLEPVKGFADLIDAVALLQARLPAQLWIVGEGNERDGLTRRIAERGLTGRARLLGFQPNPYRFMKAASVLAVSSHYEGFGNVIVEAMACGTPVVATDCPSGPRELLEGGAGVLVPPGDAQAMADALAQTLGDAELRSRLVRAASDRVDAYSAEASARQHETLFASLLAP